MHFLRNFSLGVIKQIVHNLLTGNKDIKIHTPKIFTHACANLFVEKNTPDKEIGRPEISESLKHQCSVYTKNRCII